jgi:hypothetical protein
VPTPLARLVAVLTDATAIAALVGAVASSNAALADDKVMLGGGAGIALNGGTLCTLTIIGRDGAGAIVGLTSAHCGTTGAAVAAEGTADTLGNVVATDDRLDYAVIKFDPAKVAPIPDFDGFAINGLGPEPSVGEWACKQSRANGHVCFSVRSGRAILGPDTFTAKRPGSRAMMECRLPSTTCWWE